MRSALDDAVQDLQSDIGHLHHLLEVLSLRTEEQNFVNPNGSRNEVADQIHALAKIATEMTERMNVAVDACVVKAGKHLAAA